MNKELKTNIRRLRFENNEMSQQQLANLVGVRRETIGRLENGEYNPSLELAYDISKVFNLNIEDVFYYETVDE